MKTRRSSLFQYLVVLLGVAWFAWAIISSSATRYSLIGEWHSTSVPGAAWMYPTTMRFIRGGKVEIVLSSPTGPIRREGTYQDKNHTVRLTLAAPDPALPQPGLRLSEPMHEKMTEGALELSQGEGTTAYVLVRAH